MCKFFKNSWDGSQDLFGTLPFAYFRKFRCPRSCICKRWHFPKQYVDCFLNDLKYIGVLKVENNWFGGQCTLPLGPKTMQMKGFRVFRKLNPKVAKQNDYTELLGHSFNHIYSKYDPPDPPVPKSGFFYRKAWLNIRLSNQRIVGLTFWRISISKVSSQHSRAE